jgi:hypothetical protein
MNIYLVDEYKQNKIMAKKIAAYLKFTVMKDITSKVDIIYDPEPTNSSSYTMKDNIDKDLAEVKINPHPNYPMGCGDLSNYDLTPSRDPQLLNQVLNQKMILMYIH